MIVIEQAKQEMSRLRKQLAELADALDVQGLKKRREELTAEQESEGFWTDLGKAKTVNREAAAIDAKLEKYDKLVARTDDLEVLIELCLESGTDSEQEEIAKELAEIDTLSEELRLQTLLNGKYDANDAILSLHAGAGGTEAQDWVSMLYRMYTRYAERNGFKVTVIDSLAGDDAGLKSITFTVEGENAYGYLKAEKGVHRLVRISPFDSQSRRQTSFALLEVMPKIDDNTEIVVKPEDLKIDTYRSGGAGGQHVNKTDSAVRITHIPTGIVVQCQNERSQIQNREQAMKMLIGKLAEKQEQELQEHEAELKGEVKKIEWGSQIRSYVFCPYTMVKDHRTGCETGNITAVMDGDLEQFIFDYLKKSKA